MWTPSRVGKPRFRVSSRRKPIVSSTKWQRVAGARPPSAPPAPATVMHVPPSGAPSAATARQRDDAVDARRLGGGRTASGPRRPITGLKLTLASLRREILRRRGSRAAPGSCRRCRRRSCRRSRWRHLPATARTLATILSKVPWPPRSGRLRSCAALSPSSVTLTPVRPNGSSRSTTSGVSSRPLVMMLIDSADAASRGGGVDVLGEVVDDRQVEQRLAAEERQRRGFSGRIVVDLPRPRARRPRAAVSSDILWAWRL